MVSMTAVATLTPRDVARRLFAEAAPHLDSGWRADVDDCLNDGDYDVALVVLVKAIDAGGIQVDRDLLSQARTYSAELSTHF